MGQSASRAKRKRKAPKHLYEEEDEEEDDNHNFGTTHDRGDERACEGETSNRQSQIVNLERTLDRAEVGIERRV